MAYLVQVSEQMKTPVTDYYINKMCDEVRTTMPEIHITRVKIINSDKFLHAAYQIRKAQYERTRGFCPTEDLFHATAEQNVMSILKNNLDWRRVKRSRFGVGVSFSKSPAYANKFCNNRNGDQRVFIICEVLTGNALKVDSNCSPYPRSNIDTYRSESNMVIVKFEDDSFYPKCVIYYQTNSNGPARPIRIFPAGPSYSTRTSTPDPYRSVRATSPDPFPSVRITSTSAHAESGRSASNSNSNLDCRIL